jgi:Short C-terminal domain
MGGLLRGMARTAVVAGTATAVSNRVSRRQAGRWAQQDQQAYQEPAYQQQAYQQPVYAAPPPPAAPAGMDMDTKLAQLKELAQLKDQGILTEAEFAAQKASILNA